MNIFDKKSDIENLNNLISDTDSEIKKQKSGLGSIYANNDKLTIVELLQSSNYIAKATFELVQEQQVANKIMQEKYNNIVSLNKELKKQIKLEKLERGIYIFITSLAVLSNIAIIIFK